jgi:hypothetical protein
VITVSGDDRREFSPLSMTDRALKSFAGAKCHPVVIDVDDELSASL